MAPLMQPLASADEAMPSASTATREAIASFMIVLWRLAVRLVLRLQRRSPQSGSEPGPPPPRLNRTAPCGDSIQGHCEPNISSMKILLFALLGLVLGTVGGAALGVG